LRPFYHIRQRAPNRIIAAAVSAFHLVPKPKLVLLPIEWVIFRNLDVMAVFDDDTLADR
jgi:hypothetical protein